MERKEEIRIIKRKKEKKEVGKKYRYRLKKNPYYPHIISFPTQEKKERKIKKQKSRIKRIAIVTTLHYPQIGIKTRMSERVE